jgi:hypothetical protein
MNPVTLGAPLLVVRLPASSFLPGWGILSAPRCRFCGCSGSSSSDSFWISSAFAFFDYTTHRTRSVLQVVDKAHLRGCWLLATLRGCLLGGGGSWLWLVLGVVGLFAFLQILVLDNLC